MRIQRSVVVSKDLEKSAGHKLNLIARGDAYFKRFSNVPEED